MQTLLLYVIAYHELCDKLLDTTTALIYDTLVGIMQSENLGAWKSIESAFVFYVGIIILLLVASLNLLPYGLAMSGAAGVYKNDHAPSVLPKTIKTK